MDVGPFGFSEILLVGILVLVLFGPRRLPEIGRTAGRVFTQLRRSSTELRRAFEAEVEKAGEPVRELSRLDASVHQVGQDLRSAGADLLRGVVPASSTRPSSAPGPETRAAPAEPGPAESAGGASDREHA